MAPSARVQAAFRAMREIGIPEQKTKPVLKKLLKVYDKNWELIEQENYRVLADAIFEDEDTAQGNALEEEGEGKPEHTLKRLRRGQGHAALSIGPSSTAVDGSIMKDPEPEQTDDPEEGFDIGSGILHRKNKGKRPMSPQCVEISRQLESSQPLEGTSHSLLVKEANKEAGIVLSPKQRRPNAGSSIMSSDDPLTDTIPVFEMPLAVIHPAGPSAIDSSSSQGPPQNVASSKPNGVDKYTEMASSAGVKISNSLLDTNGQSSVVFEKTQLSGDDMRRLYDATDLTRGQENIKVSLVGQSMTELPAFHYISQSIVYSNARVKFSLARIGDKVFCPTCCGDCSLSSTPCTCTFRNGGCFPYTPEGFLTESFLEKYVSEICNPQKNRLFHCKACPLEKCKEVILEPCKGHLERKFIKECWAKCGCSKNCVNRVVQRGITSKLQVFWTPEGKGWGLRTLEELPKGAFVCEYAGEILTVTELHQRGLQKTGSAKHSYSVALDAGWDSGCLKDDQTLCLDATFYGNVARFINHRCLDANLIEIPVQVETPDRHYYHVALFSKRKIDALEELTWDYGIDFDDQDRLFKLFRCLCGSSFCRNMKRSSRSRAISN